MSDSGLFARTQQFPNPEAQERLESLVGRAELLNDLVTNAVALLDHSGVHAWSTDHHGEVIPAATALLERTPMFIFAGDVGVGKTEVAEVLGQAIASHINRGVVLYPLSLAVRGHGSVGEMTSLLTSSFELVRKDFTGTRNAEGRASSMGILFIDEADAIAQSREAAQMHHEDRAGVNALLRGIDSLRTDKLPVLTILSTNRLDALDPAVQRRAAAIRTFNRPDKEQRKMMLTKLLVGSKITDDQIEQLARATGETTERAYGYTYSDLRQRLIPEAVIFAYRQNNPITYDLVADVLSRTPPTRPFGGTTV